MFRKCFSNQDKTKCEKIKQEALICFIINPQWINLDNEVFVSRELYIGFSDSAFLSLEQPEKKRKKKET